MNLPRKAQLLSDYPVWITGVGAISAAGLSAKELFRTASEGLSKASWQDFDGGHRYLSASISEIDHLSSRKGAFSRLDRVSQLAGLAVEEAVDQAGITTNHPRTGVIFGSSRGTFSKYLEAVEATRHRRISPLLAANGIAASISGSIAHRWKLESHSATVSTACASAAHAIACAAERIILGDADTMITGGTEACLHPAVLGPLAAAGVLGSHADDALACRPFDLDRNGLVPGEGAGCLVLEAAETASKRGARPIAFLRGWATKTDLGGRTGVTVDGSSLLATMSEAVRLAGLSADQIDYISAHGTGTKLNDLTEAKAIAKFQCDATRPIPVSSTKPVTGHCLGATPALEAIITISALDSCILPPTVGCLSQDPECQIALVTAGSLKKSAQVALLNSLGFWGNLATLVIQSAR